jgi:Zn-finger nucleic acid-binding protein
MPLSTSPIDGAPMRQIVRYGIEFDVCASTGGVWLDRGELEKLIDFVKMETRHEVADQDARFVRDRDDDDNDRLHNRQGGRKRSRLADLFDF